MEISRNDVMLLLVMALSIVSMSMVFPALGLASDTVQANEIPTFTVDSQRFNFSGDVPPAPGSPSSYTLTWRNNSSSISRVWLDGDTAGGTEVFIAPPSYSSTGDPVLVVNKWSAGNVTYTETLNYTAGETTNYYVNESLGYKLGYVFLENDDAAGVYSARIEVVAEVADAGWLSDVPLVGAAIEAGQATAATLWWFIEVAIWAVTYILQQGGNFLGVTVDTIIYIVSLMAWLGTTYASIVSAASAWAATFVALPGIIFSALLGKFVIIGMRTLAELR